MAPPVSGASGVELHAESTAVRSIRINTVLRIR